MKHIIFSFYLLILYFISFIKSIDNQCFFIDTDSFSFYSIYDLSRGKDDIDHNYPIPDTQKIIYFNFCAVLSKNKTAQVIIDNNGEKTMLSNDKPDENKWESFENGVIIKLSSGENCSDTEKYSIKYKITCNDDIDELKVKEYDDKNLCNKTLSIESKYGCPQFSVYNFICNWNSFMFFWKKIYICNNIYFFIYYFCFSYIYVCF